MKTTWVDYEIGTQFVCALEYGYADDLSVDEARALVRWEACLMDGYTDLDGQEYEYMHIDTATGAEDEFGLCEITNMRGRTATVRAVYRQVLAPAFGGVHYGTDQEFNLAEDARVEAMLRGEQV